MCVNLDVRTSILDIGVDNIYIHLEQNSKYQSANIIVAPLTFFVLFAYHSSVTPPHNYLNNLCLGSDMKGTITNIITIITMQSYVLYAIVIGGHIQCVGVSHSNL